MHICLVISKSKYFFFIDILLRYFISGYFIKCGFFDYIYYALCIVIIMVYFSSV